MKKYALRIVLTVVLVGAGIIAGVNWPTTLEAESNAAVPGSADDPVVTKSYVDEQIAKAGGSGGGTTQPETGGGSAKLEVVSVPNGKTLIANEGTEVVVRAGKAIVYTTDSNGIADLTDGKDLTNGKSIPANHHILFPRAGRGVTTDPSYTKSLTLLVRGSYVIQ
ncbi:hypothetical protein M3194_12025 [Paenibacillus glycanilyticus]|uniref:hypothetical protein n=1 Tax=Paenibacillus glycanilyticus TaxID=126569 RepID=UPI0020421F6F|nr:hypothetical protein [Paenibacillus glycanilyticus]MCM3628093.1 hypothetical protein [Paenibacillus glycanilyticus]